MRSEYIFNMGNEPTQTKALCLENIEVVGIILN